VIRVLLAEDQAMIREALAALLSFEEDFEVVAKVGRGDEVTAAAKDAKPDVALLDIEMPGADGLTAAAALRRECPGIKIIILTTFGRPGYLRRAMESGASGFIVKDSPADKLVRTIRDVLAGQRVIDPDLAAAALAEGASPLTRGAGRGRDARPDRRRPVPVGRHGAQLPVVLHPEGRRPQPRRGHPDSPGPRLAVTARLVTARVVTDSQVINRPAIR
jgi:two-component system response regulator DesR